MIIFSHGSTNMPIDYAFTLEDLAAAGFVVAAPTHVNNSQDDVRMDFANREAVAAGFAPIFSCMDGRPSPCARAEVPRSMADRARDMTYTLDALSAELDNRVDLERVGAFGHSRGTVTALTAAGGSTTWGVSAEPRIKAVMGMAIGVPAITFSANISSITQPTLLVAGSLDLNSPPSISQKVVADLPDTTEGAYVEIKNALHRTFGFTYCRQMQSAAAIVQANGRTLLDLHTLSMLIDLPPPAGLSMDYCGFETFTRPTDVRVIVESLTGFQVTRTNVPTTGLTSDDLRPCISELATAFFEHNLGEDHMHQDHEHRVEKRCGGLIAGTTGGQ